MVTTRITAHSETAEDWHAAARAHGIYAVAIRVTQVVFAQRDGLCCRSGFQTVRSAAATEVWVEKSFAISRWANRFGGCVLLRYAHLVTGSFGKKQPAADQRNGSGP